MFKTDRHNEFSARPLNILFIRIIICLKMREIRWIFFWMEGFSGGFLGALAGGVFEIWLKQNEQEIYHLEHPLLLF